MGWDWEKLCGNGTNFTIWHKDDFGRCFEQLGIVIVPNVLLAITSAFYFLRDHNRRLLGAVPHSPTLWLRFIISLLLMLSPVIAMALLILYVKLHPSMIDIISWCISALSWLIHSGYLWRLRRLYHIHIRGHTIVVISFLLNTASTALQLRTTILHMIHDNDITSRVEAGIYCTVTILHFLYLLGLLACKRPAVAPDHPSAQGNIQSEEDSLLGDSSSADYGTIQGSRSLGTAEDGSNCLSRLFFTWVHQLMAKGAAGNLTISADLFHLPRRLRTCLIEEKFSGFLQQHLMKQAPAERLSADEVQESLHSLPHVSFQKERSSSAHHGQGGKAEKKLHLLSALNRAFGLEYYSLGILKLLGDSFTFAGPVLLNLLVSYMESPQEPVWHGYVYAAGLFASTFLGSMFSAHFSYMVQVVGLKVRAAIITTVYRKTLKAGFVSLSQFSTGQVVNFMSTDTDRIVNFCPSFHQFWSLPVQTAVTLYLLHQQVGLAFLAGLGFAILLIPINRWLAIKIAKLSTSMMSQKDARVKFMSELLLGIRIIKFYAWEEHMSERISELRTAELKSLKGRKYLDAMCVYFWATAPVIISILTFSTYALLGNQLTAAKVFTSMALFNILIVPLNAFPWVLNGLMEAWVSLHRVDKFMQLTEEDWKHYYSDNLDVEADTVIEVQSGIFSWHPAKSDCMTSDAVTSGSSPAQLTSEPAVSDPTMSNDSDSEADASGCLLTQGDKGAEEPSPQSGTLNLSGINLTVKQGNLLGIVGRVGCGKSSLLSALLGEMRLEAGYIQVADLSNGFGLATQETWIQHDTLKNNILFGQLLDQARYGAVIEACALQEDLKVLPAGDQTEIGENGVTLSGGQKARVALARAVYQDKDIYLLDDPLAAVDAHVAQHLFDRCIMGMLRDKTRILCTHHVHFLQQADQVVVMDNGCIVRAGHPDEVLNNLDTHIFEQDSQLRKASLDGADNFPDEAEIPAQGDSLVQEEEKDTGVVKLHVYKSYWVAVGNCLATLVLVFLFLMQASKNVNDWWLSYWVTHSHTDGQHSNSTIAQQRTFDGLHHEYGGMTLPLTASWSNVTDSSDNVQYYLMVYGILAGANSVFALARAFLFAYGGICAATTLHSQLLGSILKAPVGFFDVTPIGRIINRFSSDMYAIDDTLPFVMNILLAQTFGVLGTLVITCYGLPWFAVTLLPQAVLYFYIQRYYRQTSRELKRISSVTLSPIYAHFSETISGLTTIKALRETHRFQSENRARLEENQRAQFTGVAASMWLTIRLQMMGVAMVTTVAFIAVLEHHFQTVNPGLVGLAISYALSITGLLNGVVTYFAETEKQMVAVERASQYIEEVPHEKNWAVLSVPPFWPVQGSIIFHRVGLQYREGLPLALQSVSFETQPAEKVGIVGRTGSGKSSLFLALFRMVELKLGHIEIDGINIAHLPLPNLRSRLAVIPQDPFLFSGTVRENLDPTFCYSEHDLWDVLERCHLKDVVQRLGGLDAQVAERGRHFSVGQRQLICLGRALLTKAKVLCIDEATASVDLETDQFIQQMIREQFANNTVLTIAHRIHTIMDSDRVLVMQAGHVAEFEPPQVLLANPDSLFYGLVHGHNVM